MAFGSPAMARTNGFGDPVDDRYFSFRSAAALDDTPFASNRENVAATAESLNAIVPAAGDATLPTPGALPGMDAGSTITAPVATPHGK